MDVYSRASVLDSSAIREVATSSQRSRKGSPRPATFTQHLGTWIQRRQLQAYSKGKTCLEKYILMLKELSVVHTTLNYSY